MIPFVLLLLSLASVSAHAIPTDGGCRAGQSYWCQNEATAKSCQALQYCRSQVWATQEPQICQNCRLVLRNFEDMLFGPAIRAKAVNRAKSMCNQLPNQYVNQCDRILVDWIRNLFNFFNNNVRFEMACEFLVFCGNREVTSVHEDLQTLKNYMGKHFEMPSGRSDFACNTCKAVLDQLDTLIASEDFQQSVENFLDSTLCEAVPQHLISPCKEHVQKYGKLVFDMIVSEMDSKVVCEVFRLCAPSKKTVDSLDTFFTNVVNMMARVSNGMSKLQPVLAMAHSKAQGTSESGGECSLCQLFVQEILSILKDAHSQDQVIHGLEHICAFLPEPLGDECRGFVENNGRGLIKILMQMLSPKVMCETLGMCGDNISQHELVSLLKPTFQFAMTGQVSGWPEKLDVQVGDAPWCIVCREVVTIMDQALGSQELDNALTFVIDQLCLLVPEGSKATCQTIIKRVIDAVLSALSVVTQPGLTCGIIGVCEINLTPRVFNNTAMGSVERILNFHPVH